jgi:signal transduction histidine kinase
MNSKGIGLGLVIAQKIVKQFEGEITCKSKPGFGSKFTIKFRIFDEPDENQGQIE